MRMLMQMECKKYKIYRYLTGTVLSILFCIGFITMSLYDNVSHADIKDSMETCIISVSVLVCTIFLVYAAVMLSTIVMSEYNNKTILIMFTYPINKRKLIMAKFLVVLSYMLFSMLLAFVVLMFYIGFIDLRLDWVEGGYTPQILMRAIRTFGSNMISCSMLLCFTFAIGMLKKSGSVTIVASLIALFIRQVLISSNEEYFCETPIHLLILALVAGGTLYYTFRKYISNESNL